MKKITLVIISAGTFLFGSCGARQEVVDKMADEMCSAMAKYNEKDPSTMKDTANDLLGIASKETEYKAVTEVQMRESMAKKCPNGYKKFLKMSEEAKK